jgi:hypothetical protein
MQKIVFRSIVLIISLVLVFYTRSVALAHGDEPRLEINVERVNPGGVIELRGVDFEMDELITLELIGSDRSTPLGESVADVEGMFTQIITLPADLKEGTYLFRATTDDHVIESPSFVVWGAAVAAENEEQRTDEDPLLAPMPTYAPGVSVTPMPVVEALETPAVPDGTFSWTPVLLGAAVLVLLFFMIVIVRKRRA